MKISFSKYVKMAKKAKARLKKNFRYVGFGNWVSKRKTQSVRKKKLSNYEKAQRLNPNDKNYWKKLEALGY